VTRASSASAARLRIIPRIFRITAVPRPPMTYRRPGPACRPRPGANTSAPWSGHHHRAARGHRSCRWPGLPPGNGCLRGGPPPSPIGL